MPAPVTPATVLEVAVPAPLMGLFDYLAPAGTAGPLRPGVRVRVPFGKGTRVGLVADCSMTGPTRLFAPVIRYAIRRADGGQLAAFAATFTTAPPG